ncbi:MAG: UDP-N-acetylmuramoyl-L-alanine--D-glutamate ligase [Clostridia bacterium]|nr:UDP-N-acetylmuramoyl-L-alanine--D-glutamate ligase [Clostridia bacterium]
MIFRSPSCRPDRPEIIEEKKRGAILTSEIEIVMNLCPSKIIGITGSDGKTTTTSIIYEIINNFLQEFSIGNCYLGGNIGTPLFEKIKEFTPNDVVVLELSSFQLMEIKKSPDIAVITNISPNHLDIHKSYEEYIDAKKNIFKFQDEKGILVLNYDDNMTRQFIKEANGKVKYFSRKEKLENGCIYDNEIIKLCKNGVRRQLFSKKDVYLKGDHNFENICASICATEEIVNIETIISTIKEFKGVEHRLEFIKEIEGVKWYNDSIGTSPTRTIAGLNSFDEKVVLIAGGYDKNLDYTPIAKPIIDNVSSLILMGGTADKIYDVVVKELKKEGKTMQIYKCKTLEETVSVAAEIANRGEIVLFSPASASFDLFKNFVERGNKFKELVNRIKG